MEPFDVEDAKIPEQSGLMNQVIIQRNYNQNIAQQNKDDIFRFGCWMGLFFCPFGLICLFCSSLKRIYINGCLFGFVIGAIILLIIWMLIYLFELMKKY